MSLVSRRRAPLDSRLRGNDDRWLCAFVFGVILFVTPAHAADPSKPDPALCRALVNATPAPDVAYKPGVDVHGHYVAPADVDSGPSPLPSKITFPLTVSLAKVLNVDSSQYPYNQMGAGTEAQIGTITVEGNNVTLDGKPLSGGQQSELATLCAKMGR